MSCPVTSSTEANISSEKVWDLSLQQPEGFLLSENVVTEEAWEEIRSYLGLTIGADDGRSIVVKGFDDDDSSTPCIRWESTPFPQNRPVAQFGFRYDYELDVVDPDGTNVPKIPDVFLRNLIRPYYVQSGADDDNGKGSSARKVIHHSAFTQCIVNVYRPSTYGTTTSTECANEDSFPTESSIHSSIPWHVDDLDFGPDILVFTFGETRPLCMRWNKFKHQESSNGKTACEEFRYFTAYPGHRSSYVLSGEARHRWEHSVPPGSGWRVSITFRTLRSSDS